MVKVTVSLSAFYQDYQENKGIPKVFKLGKITYRN